MKKQNKETFNTTERLTESVADRNALGYFNLNQTQDSYGAVDS